MSIRWFAGLVVLGAAGIAALLAVSALGDVAVRTHGSKRALTGAERTQAVTLVNTRWPHALTEISGACWQREDDGAGGAKITGTIAGDVTGSDAELQTAILAGQTVKNGLIATSVHFDTTGSERTALAALFAGFWAGPLSTVERACMWRDDDGQIVGRVTGIETITESEAVTRAKTGDGVEPVGVVE